jgi:hypothetical protein
VLKLARATFGVWNGMERALKPLNISIRNEITVFSSKSKDCVLRYAGLVSELKLAWATIGVQNGVERPFKRRDISIRNEVTVFSLKY